jgi:para-aminobenzoate synthetase/4-amino-4-deoxychorismate lyase
MHPYHHLDTVAIGPLISRTPPVVLLDSATPDRENRFSYLFHAPRTVFAAHTIDAVAPLLDEIDHCARQRRYWIAGFIAYEVGYALEPRLLPLYAHRAPECPLLWFGVFDAPHIFDHAAGRWDRPVPRAARARAADGDAIRLRVGTTAGRYARAVGAIRRLIARGHTYQVNFTFDSKVSTDMPPAILYGRLREQQPAAHCAFIDTGGMQAASFSPELFFSVDGRKICVRPMKGTAPRGRFSAQDRAIALHLSRDPKNRAENVMIVDLERNDLGRICRTGSVRVDSLFDVQTLATVHQMTSTVSGTLAAGIGFGDIVRALFPCGSVTGAPKIRTMEIIRQLETRARGIYCGAIGYIAPAGAMRFSVPIRTLQRHSREPAWHFGVGSGIVWDSHAAAEWQECRMKYAFLTRRTPNFELLESLLWNGRFVCLREHLDRLRDSARYFGVPLGAASLRTFCARIRGACRRRGPLKVRVLLDKTGLLRWDAAPVDTRPPARARAALSKTPIDERNPLLYHKTAHRPWYDAAMARIARGECFDVIHVNRRREITEGARSNVFVRRGAILYTPPIASGCLPGVLRGRLLAAGACRERVLHITDLLRADAVFCGNSVRGLVRVDIRQGKHP